ncbi:MAG TPA: polysaccharide biosynthesis tyrosine autokinase [Bdellovibrionota bacterium]|nr:polysaccharide biosynthesis tyrosine autokinase [Bdellovibrionota bacterium]
MPDLPVKEYLHQIWKRRKVAGLFLVSVFVIVTLVTMRQARVYRAVTVIEIGAETPDVAFFQDVVNVSPYGWWSALKYYETQYQILKSRALLSKVAARGIEKGLVKGMSADQLTSHLQNGISIGSDDKSRLAQVYFDDNEPKRAQTLANLIAEVYVDENLSQKLLGITQAVEWLNQRLKEIQAEKKQQEQELQKYKEEYKVVSLQDGENVAKANLVALTESLNTLKSKRIELEAQYRKLSELVKQSTRAEDLLGVVSSDLLTKLKHDLADLRSERSKLIYRYGEKHPSMIKLNAQVTEIERLIRQEVANEVSRLKTKFLLAKAEEDSISEALEKQKMEALRIDEVNRKLADIQVITNTNQQLFETLQKKIKEADLSGLVRSNNIRIVDRAVEPGSPIRPDVKTNLLLAVIIGLLGGIGLALALEYLDDTIKTHEDVERYLKLTVLGLIPRFGAGANGNGKDGEIAFVPFREPTVTVSEFYRTLRTNILFLSATKGLKKILIVSTGPGEGKTVTAINLGITLAQTGERTVIIDLDLRRPKLHHNFNAPSRMGVTNVLLGELTLEKAVQKSEIKDLDYLVAGSIPPNPAELLGSKELRQLLDRLAQMYDRVIVDSSPVAPVTDAVVVSQAVDGVVMIVRAAHTHRKAVIFALDQIKAVRAEVLGAVLNDVDIAKSTYGNYQYYKYGYYSYKTETEDAEEPELPRASA